MADDRSESIQKLAELIKDIEVAMLTTVDDQGGLRSRPMMTQKTDFDGSLWFFTYASAPKVDEVQVDREVNLAYANPSKQRYVSISGIARLTRDPGKIRELWNPVYKIFFPNGPDDPDLALLQVEVNKAEYWDSGSSKVGQIINFVKGAITRNPEEMGENRKLDL